MKPPSRRRITPSRFSELKRTEPNYRFRPGGYRQEKRTLLLALKQQQKLNSELDFLTLRKKVPTWSLLEIQNAIKSLRRRVVQRAYLQVQKQRREARKTKVPIEIWAELAQKMAGVHEEMISSAFSQMLVIASTEPCSLLHSDPPLSTDAPKASRLRTIPMRPMPRSQPGSGLPSTPPPVIILPGRTCKTPVQSHGKAAASSPSAQTTTATSPHLQPSLFFRAEEDKLQQRSIAGKVPTKPSTPTTPTTPKSPLSRLVSKPTPPVPASSAMSTAALSLPSHSDQTPKHPESGQSEQACQPRPMGLKCVVDFEKIYQFMSNINLKSHSQALTAMESAVLLDLLMSLPEELPLLDCKELQHHLLQVHARLNTLATRPSTDQGPAVANSASVRVTEQQTSRGTNVSLQTQSVQSAVEESVQKGAVTEQAKATESPLAAGDVSSQSSAINPPKDKGDWAAAGLCPLNPFMVSVALLKRQ